MAFYREADVSKELAENKEYKCVQEGNSRALKKKRLVLANLKETYRLLIGHEYQTWWFTIFIEFFKEKFPKSM